MPLFGASVSSDAQWSGTSELDEGAPFPGQAQENDDEVDCGAERAAENQRAYDARERISTGFV